MHHPILLLEILGIPNAQFCFFTQNLIFLLVGYSDYFLEWPQKGWGSQENEKEETKMAFNLLLRKRLIANILLFKVNDNTCINLFKLLCPILHLVIIICCYMPFSLMSQPCFVDASSWLQLPNSVASAFAYFLIMLLLSGFDNLFSLSKCSSKLLSFLGSHSLSLLNFLMLLWLSHCTAICIRCSFAILKVSRRYYNCITNCIYLCIFWLISIYCLWIQSLYLLSRISRIDIKYVYFF